MDNITLKNNIEIQELIELLKTSGKKFMDAVEAREKLIKKRNKQITVWNTKLEMSFVINRGCTTQIQQCRDKWLKKAEADISVATRTVNRAEKEVIELQERMRQIYQSAVETARLLSEIYPALRSESS